MINLEISQLFQRSNKNEIEIVTNICRILNNFHGIKQEMVRLKGKQPHRYKLGDVYIGLKMCGRPNCLFCPHDFVIKRRTAKGIMEIGKRVSRRLLLRNRRGYMYKPMKKLEKQCRELKKERDVYAKAVRTISVIAKQTGVERGRYNKLCL
jgi:hypothetical protein